MSRAPANTVLSALPTTIFTVMSQLAAECGAINLGQGFPDDEGPEDLRRMAAEALIEGPNQYPPMSGLPALRSAVARHDQRFYGIEADPQTEVLVTSGATEALAAAFFGLLNPQDEAVVIEPAYDSYAPIIRRAGAVPRFVRLRPPDWRIDRAELLGALNARTRLIVINSPMNPTGKVFSKPELNELAAIIAEHDLIAVCDEVYEHLVFQGHEHIPLMTLPGMRERCVRIASAGKTFSLTGWKVGYATAAPALISAMAKAHQFLTFTTPPALQFAVARGLAKEDIYFRELQSGLEARRDQLALGLSASGFQVLPSQGTYFIVADAAPLGVSDDLAFAKMLARESKVASIPLSAFYENAQASGAPSSWLRFCFCKSPAVLNEATSRLVRGRNKAA